MEETKNKIQNTENIKKIDNSNKKIEHKNIVTSPYPAYVSEYPLEQLIHFLHR